MAQSCDILPCTLSCCSSGRVSPVSPGVFYRAASICPSFATPPTTSNHGMFPLSLRFLLTRYAPSASLADVQRVKVDEEI